MTKTNFLFKNGLRIKHEVKTNQSRLSSQKFKAMGGLDLRLKGLDSKLDF